MHILQKKIDEFISQAEGLPKIFFVFVTEYF